MRDTIGLLRFLLHISASGRRSVQSGNGRATRLAVFAVVVSGLIAGLGNTALIAMVNEAIRSQEFAAPGRIALFAGCALAVAISRFVSRYWLASIAARAVFELRMRLCTQILSTPLRTVERIGPARILAHLTDDIGAVSEAVVQIPMLLVNLAIVGSCLLYLGWLSWQLLLALCVVLILAIALYRRPLRRSAVFFREARGEWNRLYAAFQALTNGIKELQLHQARTARFYDERLAGTAERIRRNALAGYSALAFGHSCGQLLFFIVLGLMVFGVPRFWTAADGVVTAYAFVLLFLIGPLDAILNVSQVLTRARVAAEQLQHLESEMPAGAAPEPADKVLHGWREIRLRDVTYSHQSGNGENAFVLGPVDLVLEPGEVVFLTGGNGSGKTTLAKMLTGLYAPDGGSITVDGAPVSRDNLAAYRSLFSAVFSDFHLFDALFGLERSSLDAEAREYLKLLRLDSKIRIEGGVFSTVDLSQGQRKRLALLTAYLEDRPIYVFDEWTADQEPVFREVFYRHLLPGLRARSKTVVVITHDDRYFDTADRIVELEWGRVRNQQVLRKGALV